MSYRSARPVLKLFIEKANALEQSSFLESIFEEFRLGFSWEVNKPMEVTSIRPKRESLDAFILTFRFFIQDNEEISLRNLKKFFNSDAVYGEEKDEYYSLTTKLNNFLADYSNLTIKENKLTNGEIMDTVLFGDLSHATKSKKKKFDLWMNGSELMRESIWHKFIYSIMQVVDVVTRIKYMLFKIINRNTVVLCQLTSKNYGAFQCEYTINNFNAISLNSLLFEGRR